MTEHQRRRFAALCQPPSDLLMERINLPRALENDVTALGNEVYRLGVKHFETRGEHSGKLLGNGHHMAKYLAGWARIIYLAHVRETVAEEGKDA